MLALLVVIPVQAAGIYKIVQPDGTVVYSDRPAQGAEEVKLPELQTYTPPPSPAGLPNLDALRPPTDEAAYERFVIASPANDATLRDNGGNVSISLDLAPGLKPGHSVDIRMDGESLGKGAGTSITLTNVDRGSHTVQAVVVDADGQQVATTPSITFHLQRVAGPVKAPRAP